MAILADGIGSTHGVTRTIQEIRERGVSGYEIEVVATDPEVDRRLSAVAEIDVPYYPGLRIGVPRACPPPCKRLPTAPSTQSTSVPPAPPARRARCSPARSACR